MFEQQLKNDVLKCVEKNFEWIRNIRRDFHMYPELGMEETRTSKVICEILDELDIPYKKGIANTGVVGLIEVENAKGTVALRADMDALPLHEENNVPYRSVKNGLMHACGHDAHVAIQLGVAKVLSELKDKLKVNVKLIFQPAEETVGGALPMIKESVLRNPDVDFIFGLHVDSGNECGIVSMKYGVSQASVDSIKIIIHGKSGHGAHPASAVDAIMISGHVISAIQSIVSRNISATDSLVITIGKINGGTKENIIADKVVMEGTMRSLNDEISNIAIEKLNNIVRNIAESFGGKGEVIVTREYCSLENDNKVLNYIEKNAKKYVGEKNVLIFDIPSMGGEDYAFFLKEVRGAFFKIGTKNEEKGICSSAHNCHFDIDEDALKVGTAMQVFNVLNIEDIL